MVNVDLTPAAAPVMGMVSGTRARRVESVAAMEESSVKDLFFTHS